MILEIYLLFAPDWTGLEGIADSNFWLSGSGRVGLGWVLKEKGGEGGGLGLFFF